MQGQRAERRGHLAVEGAAGLCLRRRGTVQHIRHPQLVQQRRVPRMLSATKEDPGGNLGRLEVGRLRDLRAGGSQEGSTKEEVQAKDSGPRAHLLSG